MKLLVLSICLLVSSNLFAQARMTIVAVGDAQEEVDTIAFQKYTLKGALTPNEKKKLDSIIQTIHNDFSFYKHIFDIDKEHKSTQRVFKYSKWKKQGIRFLISYNAVVMKNKLSLDVIVRDTQKRKRIYEKKYIPNGKDLISFSHTIADHIYRSIRGKKSIFTTQIVFISDRTSLGSDLRKELYIMDFDGRRKKRLSFLNSLVIAPAVSPDKSQILYSAIENRWIRKDDGRMVKVKNINLRIFDMNSKTTRMLSGKKGINSGATFSKDGKSIYFTVSNQRNADIYKMNLSNRKMRRVTSHYSDDVDPHINYDETLITFLSGRSGKAMIYTADPAGTEQSVKRISYVGKFNSAPRFSPDGKEIVFSSWVDDMFDLYRIDSDGNNLSRLTKGTGSNEEAWFSPDGEFIVYTSQKVISRRNAKQDVYIMNRNGEIIKNLTNGYGKSFTPRWTN